MNGNPIVLEYLTGHAAMIARFGGRIYVALDPPTGYAPDQGPCVIFRLRGGSVDTIWQPLGVFEVYAQTDIAADEADQVLLGALHEATYQRMRRAYCVLAGQAIVNPAGWQFVRSTYQFSFIV